MITKKTTSIGSSAKETIIYAILSNVRLANRVAVKCSLKQIGFGWNCSVSTGHSTKPIMEQIMNENG